MKLATALSLIGLGIGATAFALSSACGGSEEGGTTTTAKGRQPPGEPTAGATTATDERVFAINELFLGDTDRKGAPVKDKTGVNIAWKDYGYDLDGIVTEAVNASSPGLKEVCDRAAGAPAGIHQDGTEGIDNSFGKEILKLLEPFAQTPSKTITDNIKQGDFTILLNIKGLTDDGNQSNTGLSGEILVGAPFGDMKTPTFSPADDWPFRADPRIPISGAYINQGVFVNGKQGSTIKLALDVSGQTLSLSINKAVVTFKHSPPNDLLEGTIAGVLDTEEFITGISAIAGSFSRDLCSGSTIEGIKQSIRQASDILKDGTNRAGVKCDGISIGLGFTAKRIGPAKTVVTDTTPARNPCNEPPPTDAGSDSAPQDAGPG